jgi:hypothetical protein
MKFQASVIGIIAGLAASTSGVASSGPNAATGSAQMVVTVLPATGVNPKAALDRDDLMVTLNKKPARVLRSQQFTGNLADMQLFVLLDDSARSSAVGLQIPELKAFIRSLPPTTQVAVGYMRNGTFGPVQGFTVDHQRAASAVRLPVGVPGENGSPYFALSDLVKHWPSKEFTNRHVVLMLTDGVDRYYGNSEVDDPYVDAAIQDAAKQGVLVYSIYLRDAGLYDRGSQTTLFAQSRLSQVSEETGGFAYFQDFTDPVSIAPFLNDFGNRLEHQFQVTIEALNVKGFQPVKVKSEVPGLKIEGPTRIYVQ